MAYLLPVLLAAALAVFALANPQPVAVAFWPEGWVAELPLWQAILATCLLAFLAGAVLVLALAPAGEAQRGAAPGGLLLDAELRQPRSHAPPSRAEGFFTSCCIAPSAPRAG